eukprot:2510255-Prymnesium_polylepis.1
MRPRKRTTSPNIAVPTARGAQSHRQRQRDKHTESLNSRRLEEARQACPCGRIASALVVRAAYIRLSRPRRGKSSRRLDRLRCCAGRASCSEGVLSRSRPVHEFGGIL